MKLHITLICLLFMGISFQVSSQPQWAILKGNTSIEEGYYGKQGQPHPTAVPASRINPILVPYNDKLYMLNGQSQSGRCSDLWEYDPTTSIWKWIKGSEWSDQYPVSGPLGVESSTNLPGVREDAAYWVAGTKLYIFGGKNRAAIPYTNGSVNEFWSYDFLTNNWTWISGSTSLATPGVYGVQGVAANSNMPGARLGAASWVHNGILYLLGGNGVGRSASGYLNDLWSYDPSTGFWTWLNGSDNPNITGNYGTKGVEAVSNLPKGRYDAAVWLVGDKLYLYGGRSVGNYATQVANLSDVWVYDHISGNWTWQHGSPAVFVSPRYGILNIADPENTPGERNSSIYWKDGQDLYLYSGITWKDATYGGRRASDTWKYNTVTNQWTWLGGGLYELPIVNMFPGSALSDNSPGTRINAGFCQLRDRLFVFGGNVKGIPYNDLWEMQTTDRAWKLLRGKAFKNEGYNPSYVLKHIPAHMNNPGRDDGGSVSWQIDNAAYVFSSSYYDDRIWKYNFQTNTWTWIKGLYALKPNYGVKGVPDPDNTPGGRSGAVSWTFQGKAYVFGGVSGTLNYYNDLWEYDPATRNWTWLKGATPDAHPFYGVQGIADSLNCPGGREGAVSFALNGKFYLFGGDGIDVQKNIGPLNDLWEYDPATNNWRWLKGSDIRKQHGKYGTGGVPSANNIPGGRGDASGWVLNDKIYLFGGSGMSHNSINPRQLCDLWEYDPTTNNWRWIHGSKDHYTYSRHGIMGISSSGNYPGCRLLSSAWMYNNKLYLFGGYGDGPDINSGGSLSDLWEYDPHTGNWTWISGNKQADMLPYYTRVGVFDPSHSPPVTYAAKGWIYEGQFYLFGGNGNTMSERVALNTNDIWSFRFCQTPATCYPDPPVIPSAGIRELCGNMPVILDAGNPGSSFLWNTGDTTRYLYITSPGNYTVTVTNPGNLSSTATTTVVAGTQPIMDLGNDTAFCSNSYALLDATINAPGVRYLWNTGQSKPVIQAATQGTYSVYAVSEGGCIAQDTIVLTSLPVHPVSLGSDIAICQGVSHALHAGYPGPSYDWNTGENTPVIYPDTSGTYIVNVTPSNGCISSDTIEVVFKPVPIVNLGVDTAVCPGLSVTLDAGNPGNLFLWNTGVITQTLSTGPGTYSVRVTAANGCSASDTIVVSEHQPPYAHSIEAIVNGLQCQLKGISYFASSYLWLFGDGNTGTTPEVTHTYRTDGSYDVLFIARNNCGEDTIIKKLTVNSGLNVHNPISQKSHFVLLPNPAHEFFTIQMDDDAVWTDVYLFDATGRFVRSYHNKRVDSIQQLLSTNSLGTGTYFVRAQTSLGVRHGKLEIVN